MQMSMQGVNHAPAYLHCLLQVKLGYKPSQLRSMFTASFGSGVTLTEAGLDLLQRLLAYDPAQRISAKEALNHRWG